MVIHRKYPIRITKKEFYALGGLANPDLFRKQHQPGKWVYYKLQQYN